MHRQHQLQNLAYFGGKSVAELLAMDLSVEDLRTIAGWCGKYGFESANPESREAYVERATVLAATADERAAQAETFAEWNPNPAQGWPAR